MTQAVICEKCGSGFAPSTTGGLCPRCLMRAGLDDLAVGEDRLLPVTGSIHNRSFGDYVLLEEIARGGMGVVYRARQRSLGRVVAIKMLVAGEFASPDAIRRFRAEAAATARLQHPNIVAIHEVGECDGLPFLCMDYVDGPNLAYLIREYPLPPKTAATYVKTIAEAVHYAHAQGLLHRDLKPSNVLIDPFGEPRVTDFGLAKDFAEAASRSATGAGHLAGTLGYMAPEQADSSRGALSPASDVYSLGAVLYHLLTGRAPFAAGSLHETLQQLLTSDPIAPRLLNEGVPSDLETICLRCLAKEPGRRYQRAQDLADELERFLNGLPIQARPISAFERLCFWCRRQPALAALSGAVFFLLLTLAIGATVAAIRIGSARDAETRHRARAEHSVTQFELQRADDLLREGKVSPGLAHLAHVLRQSPSNSIAASRIFSVLTRRSFGLPAAPPLVHEARIRRAIFSPDGRRIATASADGSARIWDALTGMPVTEPLRLGGDVFFARFNDTGKRLTTASREGTVGIWDAENGALIGSPIEHGGPVEIAESSRDGKILATIGAGFLQCWDVIKQSPLAGPIKIDAGQYLCLDVSMDGRFVAVGSKDGAVRVWDAATGNLATKIQHAGWVRFIEFSPEAGRLASAWDDGRARVWELPSGRRISEVAHRGVVEHVTFSPDGARIATTSRDGTARLWDAATGEPLTPPLPHYSVVRAAFFSADGFRLLTSCWDNTAWVWDARTGELAVQPLKHENRINWAAFSPDGQQVVTASEDQTAQIWDVRHGKEAMLRFPQESGGGIIFSPDGTRTLTWAANGAVRIWDAANASLIAPPFHHKAGVIWADFSPDGAKVATASFDRTAAVWDAATGRRLTTIAAHNAVVEFIEFSPDSRMVVTAARDSSARVWDAATGLPLTPPLRHDQRVWQARFSKDARLIVSSSDDGTARVWEVATGRLIGSPLKHQAPVYSAVFSSDGARVVTASFDMTARIWSATSSEPVAPPLKHYSVLRHAEFSSDGNRVITASGDNTARIWDAATGQPVGQPLHHQGELLKACFSPDGELAATVAADGTARVWDAHTGQPITEPIRQGSAWSRLAFSPNGRRLALGRTESDGFVLELSDYRTPPPPWFIDLAEAIASQKVSESGNFDFISPARLLTIKSALAASSSSNHWDRFGRWFFASRSERTISPFSEVAVPRHVASLVQGFTTDSLREALQLAPENAEARRRAARRAFEEESVPTTSTAPPNPERDTFRRWALSLPEAGWPEAEKYEDANLARAVAAIRRSSTHAPPADPGYWLTQGRIYARTNRLDEALAAFSRVIELTQTNALSLRTMALIGRRNVLLQLNRRAEAVTDPDVPLRIPPRDPRGDRRLIDLSNFYNAALTEPWHIWAREKNTLSRLEPGLQTHCGIEFDIRGIIQLAGLPLHKSQPGYPRQVRGIFVDRKCARLQFLHAAGWGGYAPMQTELGQYRIHFQSGRQEIIPIVNGEDLFEWYNIPGVENGLKRATVAWTGLTPGGNQVRLFKRTWENPRPDDEVLSFDYLSNETPAAPFLIAVTAED